MKYIEVAITLAQQDPFRDLLIDALGNEGPYDSFVETPDGLKAYVPESQFDASWLETQLDDIRPMTAVTYTFKPLPDKNWNEEWERQHQPVLVEATGDKRIWVRAPFHPHMPDADYEIEIEPKMSFGTAHHPTTYLMLSYLSELPLGGLRVLDMGCGTAVLGILAKMRGAAYVEGIDIDEWAYRNALENVQRNAVEMTIRIGDAAILAQEAQNYDLIIANINRNILLADMPAYASRLNAGGTLLLSGFYESDIPVLKQRAEQLNLQLCQTKTRSSWAALRFTKQ
ncbi:MAG: 50S ribosomal protein L11 methyltransferase [Bacteroidales bacterium]|nr:50S ribosomal protein L11 methyltransferase [Bacteroidales bacterium]